MPLLERIKVEFSTFCQASTIHGVQYVSPERGQGFRILVWGFIISFCFAAAGFFVANLADSWFENPTVTTIASSSTPVQEIPFPAVTICHDGFDPYAFMQK